MTAGDLVLDRISKTYEGAGTQAAVKEANVSIARGEFLSLLGPSGCGKTTLLRITSGFIAPTAGRVRVRGEDVTELPPQRRPTAMVFQNYALFPHMTAAGNVAFGLKVRRLPSAEIAKRVEAALAVVGLAAFGDRFPNQLSGGQQQRIALARALAIEPPVLLMDEPLGALDAKLREEMQYELRAIQRRLEITTLYVTHDQEEAFSMSDRVAVMNQGRILQIDTPDEIYRRPKTAFVANFVGRSNLMRGTVAADRTGVQTADGRSHAAPLPADCAPGAPVVLMIRPEDASLVDAGAADNHVAGTVERERFVGGAHLYFVQVGSGVTMMVADRRSPPLKPGERVDVHWHSSHSVVLPDAPPATVD